MVKCQKNEAFPFLYVKGVTLVKIHCRLVEVYGLCVYRVDVVQCFGQQQDRC